MSHHGCANRCCAVAVTKATEQEGNHSTFALRWWWRHVMLVGSRSPLKNLGSHIDASHSRQPLVKGERLVRYEVNAVMLICVDSGFFVMPT